MWIARENSFKFGPFWTEFPLFCLESGEDHLRNKSFDVITVIKMLTNQTPTEKISEIYTITTEDRMVSKNIIMMNQIELSQCSNNPRRWGKNSQNWDLRISAANTNELLFFKSKDFFREIFLYWILQPQHLKMHITRENPRI